MKIYHVRVSSCHMPNSVKAPYQRVAVMESLTGPTDEEPQQIRNTAMWRIEKLWDRRHLGYRPRGGTAAEIARLEAESYADARNRGRGCNP